MKTAANDNVLAYMNQKRAAIVRTIRELAAIESPTFDKPAVDRAMEYFADRAAPLARVKVHRQKQCGNHLRVEFRLPGRRKEGQVLGIGHLDTVWPVGTLQRMPVREAEGRLWGPGVFDMKAGVAYYLHAAEALRELEIPAARKFVVQINSEEEIGSPYSRPYTEKEARRSAAVLVTEPSFGPRGDAKTARKGGGGFVIRVKGKASHAGLDFPSGASAIVELAKQIERVASWTDLKKGITVNPGVLRGGERPNVVAESAEVEVDVRVPKRSQAVRLEKRFHNLKPFDRRTTLTVEGALNRPPMERTREGRHLFRLAERLSREMGLELGEAAVGGGSDGNFTAALGIPTLDGIGAVGEGAHALHESIYLDRIADRAALIAKLVAAI